MSGTETLDVAFVQVASPSNEPTTARVARVLPAIDTCAARSDLVLLPELWATGFSEFDRYERDASTVSEPLLDELATIARGRGAYIFVGSVIERSERGLHNSALLLDPSGQVLLRYRKIHLFGLRGSREPELLVPGAELGVAATPAGTVGVMACYDLRFPELARRLLDRGVQILLVAAAWPAARVEHWRLLVRARALENQVFVLACNAARADGGEPVPMAGHSLAVDPRGEVVVELGAEPEQRSITIRPAEVDDARACFPVLDDRRLLEPTADA